MPLGCNISSLTALSVLGAVLGTLFFVGVAVATVWLALRVHHQWKLAEYEYSSLIEAGEGASEWSGSLGCGLLLPIHKFSGLRQGQAQPFA